MPLKRVTTKEGEVYFVDAKSGQRIRTDQDVVGPSRQSILQKNICLHCGNEILSTYVICPHCNTKLPKIKTIKRKIDELTADDFPGVNVEKFDEWKQAVKEASKNTGIALTVLVIINIILITTGIGIILGGLLLVLVFSLINKKQNRLAKELGITREKIRLARIR